MPTRRAGAKVTKSKGSNTKKSFSNQVKTRAEKKTQGSARARVATLPEELSARTRARTKVREIASIGSGGGAAAGTASGNNNLLPPPLPPKTVETPLSRSSKVIARRLIPAEETYCNELVIDIYNKYKTHDLKEIATNMLKGNDSELLKRLSDLFTTYIDIKEKNGGRLTVNEDILKNLHYELIATQSQKAPLTEANAPNTEWQQSTRLGKINRRKSKKTRKRKPKKRNNKKSSKRK